MTYTGPLVADLHMERLHATDMHAEEEHTT